MINHRPLTSPFIILSIAALIAMLVIDISAQNDKGTGKPPRRGGMPKIDNGDLFNESETGSPNTAVPNTANPVTGNTGTPTVGASAPNAKKTPEKDSVSKDIRQDSPQANREVREITPATNSGESSIEIVRPANQAAANSNDSSVSKNLASSDFRQNAKQILPALAGLAIFVFIAFAFVIFKLLGKLREE